VLLRRAVIVLVAAALGVWVAIAAAQGGFGGGSTGTTCFHPDTIPCHYPRPPKHPRSFGGGGGGGGGGHSHHHHQHRRHHHSREGERAHREVEGGHGSSPVAPASFAG
jgi:hypothetical protein